jgi:Fe-S cluster biogenesis protein NfuA
MTTTRHETPGISGTAGLSLAALSDEGRITARDLDVVMVAFGELSHAGVDLLLRRREGGAQEPVLPFPEAVERVVTTIQGCQYHDGGGTVIAEPGDRAVLLEVTGACVHCPQIGYTMGIVKDAIALLSPGGQKVDITGTRFHEKTERPKGAQLTLPMVMRAYGLTFADLDAALRARGSVDDRELVRLARRARLRRSLAAPPGDTETAVSLGKAPAAPESP